MTVVAAPEFRVRVYLLPRYGGPIDGLVMSYVEGGHEAFTFIPDGQPRLRHLYGLQWGKGLARWLYQGWYWAREG